MEYGLSLSRIERDFIHWCIVCVHFFLCFFSFKYAAVVRCWTLMIMMMMMSWRCFIHAHDFAEDFLCAIFFFTVVFSVFVFYFFSPITASQAGANRRDWGADGNWLLLLLLWLLFSLPLFSSVCVFVCHCCYMYIYLCLVVRLVTRHCWSHENRERNIQKGKKMLFAWVNKT